MLFTDPSPLDYQEWGRRIARLEQDAGIVDHGLPERDDDYLMDAAEFRAEQARDDALMGDDW